jgi:S1-C subfamily serine protease/predicted esterase
MRRHARVIPAVALALLATAWLAPAQDLAEREEKALKAAVARVAPSIVQIETSGGTEMISTGPRGQPIRKGVGPTTGLIVASDGLVISSAFNFANKPTAIFVTVPGHKERYVARVVASDLTRMLTLLKIDTANLPVPQPALKKDIRIGQWALALGRTLEAPNDRELTGPPSVSVGVVSALNRIWGKALQTDAKISPVNYGGPLVNVQGQVLGVLVPASPQAEGETAGFEWYDSGIGFAVYFEDVLAVLPKLREGRDLRRGLLGITMQGNDKFGAVPTVGTVAPDSAAAKAGLRPGDVITEIDGRPVNNQAQVLHQLGTKYEGDSVAVGVKRGNETLKFENIRLSGALTSYPHPFLGILPLRDDPEPGEEIRYVYPGSPADKAGLKAGDRILKIGAGAVPMQPFAGRDQLTARLNTLQPGTEVKLEVSRKADKKIDTLTLTLAQLPDTVPDKLPEPATLMRALEAPKTPKGPLPKGKDLKKDEPKEKKDVQKPDGKGQTGLFKRSNAGGDHDYWVYASEKGYDRNISHALVVWLHPVNKSKDKDFEDFAGIWRSICDEQHVILVMPKSENDTGWLPSEAEAVEQIVQEVMGQYTIDRERVIVHGLGVGGQMAFYLGFSQRHWVRGVAATGAVLGAEPKDNVPNQRLQFFVVAGGKDPLAKDIADTRTKLSGNRFSVVYREVPDMGHQYLDAATLLQLARWIDSLDRQ